MTHLASQVARRLGFSLLGAPLTAMAMSLREAAETLRQLVNQ